MLGAGFVTSTYKSILLMKHSRYAIANSCLRTETTLDILSDAGIEVSVGTLKQLIFKTNN